MNTNDAEAQRAADLVLARKIVNKFIATTPIPETTDGTNFSFPDPSEAVAPDSLGIWKIKINDDYILGLRFFDGDGNRITQAIYDLLSATLFFLGKAHRFWDNKVPADEVAKYVENGVDEMLYEMIVILHRASLDFMSDLSDGIFHKWAQDKIAQIERESSRIGKPIRFDQKSIALAERKYLDEQQRNIKALFGLCYRS